MLMRVKRIKIHGNKQQTVKLSNRTKPASKRTKRSYNGVDLIDIIGLLDSSGFVRTAKEAHDKGKALREEEQKKTRSPEGYEYYDPFVHNKAAITTGPLVIGPDTARKMDEYEKQKKNGPKTKYNYDPDWLPYMEEHGLIETDRSEQIAKEKEAQRQAKKAKAISIASGLLKKMLSSSDSGRIVLTTRKLLKGKTEFAKFKVSNKSGTSRSRRKRKKYVRRVHKR